jgi:hypothetical protein
MRVREGSANQRTIPDETDLPDLWQAVRILGGKMETAERVEVLIDFLLEYHWREEHKPDEVFEIIQLLKERV